jgi:hypothetical protein
MSCLPAVQGDGPARESATRREEVEIVIADIRINVEMPDQIVPLFIALKFAAFISRKLDSESFVSSHPGTYNRNMHLGLQRT